MGAMHDGAHAFKPHSAWEGSFRVLDVSAQSIVNTDGLADFVGGRTYIFNLAAENQMLDLMLDFVIQLVTISAEEFDAVVGVGIVRRRDDDAGIGPETPRYVSYARRGQRPDEQNIHPHRKNARRDSVFEHVAGQPRIFPEHDP